MMHQIDILAILLICILSSSITNTETTTSRPGSWSKITSKEELHELETKLRNSNFRDTIHEPRHNGAEVTQINFALQQVVSGIKYKIESVIDVNGGPATCCSLAHESSGGSFVVDSTNCKNYYGEQECLAN